jgi:GGDEF domain-containing protein
VRRGQAFGEDLIFLQNNLISEASFLLRPPGRLGKGELEKRLVFGRAIDTRLQVEFYGSIYGTLNLKDVAERLSLKQSQWVSLAANLLRLGLLVGPDARSLQCIDYSHAPEPLPAPIAPPPPQEERFKLGVPVEIIDVHSDAVEGVLSLLQVPETKILSYTAIRFFLEREFIRAYRFKTMLSLAVFCVSSIDSHELHMPYEAVAELAGAVDKIKRDIDVMGHFGDVSFAVLLPMVDAEQAGLFVDRVQKELPQMLPHLGKYKPCLHFGIASVPAQATDLMSLGHAAQKAMLEAAEKKLPKVLAV